MMRTIEEIKADLKRAELNLKACLYEDGGLVSRAKWDVDKLKIQLFDKLTKDIPLDRLQEICDAEKDGRLVVFVCKEGDSVFRITTENVDVDGYRMQYNMQKIIVECKFLHWMSDFIGKTVFLTKEEAEQALIKEDEGK